MMNIYVGTYHKYNSGSLRGKWLELPLGDDELEKELSWIAEGENDPEFMIQDFECDFYKIDESENIWELNRLADECENWDDGQKDAFKEFTESGYDLEESLQKVKNGEFFYIDASDEKELAEKYIEICGGLENLNRETLERYFDFEAYGRELAYSFDETEHGYIDKM